jgi:phosphoribosylaminoimidazole-succinocarboxamide synthase
MGCGRHDAALVAIGDDMARRKKVYEGKAKILYEGPEPGTLVQYFKDDATAFNAQKKATVEGKGVLNNRLSEFFMKGLTQIGVPNHFIKRINMREQLIRSVEIIPLEIIVRNFAAGSLSTRLGMAEGTALPRPIVEFCLKDDALGDPLVSEEHIIAFGWASQQDLDDMVALALRVNDFMSGVMLAVGIKLVDFKIEIGRIWDNDFQRLIVADEISPDSCRLWDMETGQKLDKDVFRRDLGNLSDAYTEVARRLGVLPSNVTHATKPTLIN